MKVEFAQSRPAGVTQLMSVGGGDLGDVLDDTKTRLRNAAIAGAAGYILGRVFTTGDKPLWLALGAFGLFLVK